ncbi:hypothetical protein EDB86DRAFT_2927945, partial [Lactarius hatsudake]
VTFEKFVGPFSKPSSPGSCEQFCHGCCSSFPAYSRIVTGFTFPCARYRLQERSGSFSSRRLLAGRYMAPCSSTSREPRIPLHNCSLEFGSLIRLDLGSVTFPQLSSLSLSNFVWDDVRVDPQVVVLEAEDFILRHGKTLKKLELQNCTICVPRDRPTLVRSWAAVWNRFADKLTELVDLVVDYNFNQGYVCFLQEYGFDSNSVYFLRGTEEDTPALEALVTIMKGRQRGGVTSCDGDQWVRRELLSSIPVQVL